MPEQAGPRQLRRLLDAVLSLGSDLDLPLVLRRIVDAGQDLVEARYAALGVLDPTRTHLDQFITTGIDADEAQAIGDLPKGHGILGMLIAAPEPLRLPDLNEHPERFGFPEGHPPMQSFLGVPLYVRGEVFGNLYFTEKLDGDAFTDIDEELATGLAAAAAIAIESARLHERMQQLHVLADHERLGRELHARVMQRTSSLGHALQATAGLSHEPQVKERLLAHVDELDRVLLELRSAIFDIGTRQSTSVRVRHEILTAIEASAEALGLEPVVVLEGPLDMGVSADSTSQVLSVVREALGRVAQRDPPPRSLELKVRASSEEGLITIDVHGKHLGVHVDSGGVSEDVRRGALALGASVAIMRSGVGFGLRWSLPLAATPSPSSAS